MTTTEPKVDKHYVDQPYEPYEGIPFLTCPSCRKQAKLEPRYGPANQYYYCSVCNSEWGIDGPLPPRTHKPFGSWPEALATVLWLLLMAAGFVAILLVSAHAIKDNHWAGTTMMWMVINVAFLNWGALVFILSPVYSWITEGIGWAWRYVHGPALDTFESDDQ
jgi:hypothetical protein